MPITPKTGSLFHAYSQEMAPGALGQVELDDNNSLI
jgi:hypothetical protein